MDSSDLASMMVALGCFAMVATIVRVVSNARSRQMTLKAQLDVQTRLVDKFGSAPELASFLQTQAGEGFLKALTVERPNPMQRILGNVQAGLIFLALGGAFLLLASWVGGEKAFGVMGTLSLALGVGFLACALAAYKISKAWNILGPADRGARVGVAAGNGPPGM